MKTMLLLDDDLVILDIYKYFLYKRYGKTIEYVCENNPKRALEYFKKHKDNIDLIIFDYKMPEINGEYFILECNKIKKVPSILVTAYTDKEIMGMADRLSCDKVIIKDRIRFDLANYVEELINENTDRKIA